MPEAKKDTGYSLENAQEFGWGSGELTVERLVIVQHGYTLKGTRNYATVKDVFERAR